ncbi:MAG: hypothetical protein AB8C46_08900 [Burkholderiaceae bacterium]
MTIMPWFEKRDGEKELFKAAPICLGVVVLFLVASCGGGSNPEPTNTASQCIATNSVKSGAAGDHSNPNEGEGDGAGGGDGGGEGDGNGSLGQFFGAIVVVKNRDLDVLGQAVVDEKGEVNVAIGKCEEAVEIAFVGADGATYYDEATGQREPFPAGSELRSRIDKFGKNFSVTPYTEAAVRLMDSAGSGALSVSGVSKASGEIDSLGWLEEWSTAIATKAISSKAGQQFDGQAVRMANQRIGEVMTDQVPGIYRPRKSDGTFGVLDITAAATALNDTNFKIPGTLRDNVVGHRGAVVAGLIESGGDFLINESRPAVIVAEQFAADLSDGKLDLHSLDGPLLTGGQAPAYTFESLWRSKTVGAGESVGLAGEPALVDKVEGTPIAAYRSGLSSIYFAPDAPTGGFTTGTTANQQVELTAAGVVTVARSIAAGFKTNEWYENTRFGSPEKGVVPGRFVDVKVGTRGQVAALAKDRKSISFTSPFELYQVTGREFPGFAVGDGNRERRRSTAIGILDAAINLDNTTIRIDDAFQGEQRIVAYTPSPGDRTFRGGQKPDVLAVLQQGSLVGASRAAPQAAIQLVSPAEGLLGIAYDKLVPPANDPQTGNSIGSVSFPYQGPRRLFGLTRNGQVKTWLEEAGTNAREGRVLNVPGRAVLLASESVTNVYVLNSDGDVYWINADQAVAPSLGSRFTVTDLNPASIPRRYELNQVIKVDLGDRKACWIGRSEAIICGSGEVYRWEEQYAQVDYRNANSAFSSRVTVPVSIGSAELVNGTNQRQSAIWRFSGVESQYAIIDGESIFTEGMSYLLVDGSITNRESLLGLRNLDLPTLRFDDPGRSAGPEFRRGINGSQYQRALTTAFSEQRRDLSLRSTFSTDGAQHQLDMSIQRLGDDRFALGLVVDGGRNQQEWPNIEIKLKLNRGGLGFNGLRASNLTGGDATFVAGDNQPLFDSTDSGPGQLSNVPAFQGPVVAEASSELPLDRGLSQWQAFYRDPVLSTATFGDAAIRSSVKLLLVSGIDPYAFRVCYSLELQVKASLSGFGGLVCTSHANDGSFKGATGLLTRQAFDGSGNPIGDVRTLDFEHFYTSPFL